MSLRNVVCFYIFLFPLLRFLSLFFNLLFFIGFFEFCEWLRLQSSVDHSWVIFTPSITVTRARWQFTEWSRRDCAGEGTGDICTTINWKFLAFPWKCFTENSFKWFRGAKISRLRVGFVTTSPSTILPMPLNVADRCLGLISSEDPTTDRQDLALSQVDQVRMPTGRTPDD